MSDLRSVRSSLREVSSLATNRFEISARGANEGFVVHGTESTGDGELARDREPALSDGSARGGRRVVD